MTFKDKSKGCLNFEVRLKVDESGEYYENKIHEILGRYTGGIMDYSTAYAILDDLTEFAYQIVSEQRDGGVLIYCGDLVTVKEFDLNVILWYHKKEYPERFNPNKKEYTNVDVNNMLFDLQMAKVISSYKSPAYSFQCSNNDEIFTGSVDVHVPVINIKVGNAEW